jgi:hypothetical protein
MFFDWVWPYAAALLFVEGRIRFHHVDGSKGKFTGGAPSVLIAYGPDAAERLRKTSIPGALVIS